MPTTSPPPPGYVAFSHSALAPRPGPVGLNTDTGQGKLRGVGQGLV